jgi:hypothetical protein
LGLRNPFDVVTKLDAIARRSRTADCIWIMAGLLDFWQLGLFECGFGKRTAEGKAPGQNGKGLIDLMLYKRSFRDELISVRLDSIAWPTAVKDSIRWVCGCHRMFREKWTADVQTWRAGWPESAEKYLNLIEDTPLVCVSLVFCSLIMTADLIRRFHLDLLAHWNLIVYC